VKSHPSVVTNGIASVDRPPPAVYFLVDRGLGLAETGPIGGQHQIATRVDAHGTGVEADADHCRVGPGRDYEVVLQAAPVAVKDQVDSRIHLVIPHPGIAWHVGHPMIRVSARQVVGMRRQLAEALYFDLGARGEELHPQYRLGWLVLSGVGLLFGPTGCDGRIGEVEDDLVLREENAVAGPTGHVLDLWIGLATIDLEAQGEAGIGHLCTLGGGGAHLVLGRRPSGGPS